MIRLWSGLRATLGRALGRWERTPARFRQSVTVILGVSLVAAVGAVAVSCAPRTPPPAEARVVYAPVPLDSLPGWHSDRVGDALPALRRACDRLAGLPHDRGMAPKGGPALQQLAGPVGDWQRACRALMAVPAGDEATVRRVLADRFQAYEVAASDGSADGRVTGYYEAHIRAARVPGEPFTEPVFGPPIDLVMESGQGRRRTSDGLVPYHDRAAIEDGAVAGLAPVLFWADDPVDLHILHIQGSGQVTLPDGSRTRIGYAANNGQPFVGIGALVRERGLADGGSMPAIRAWLRANPAEGRTLMRQNPRYIFFREITGDGPIGASGVPLTPLRSVAVDPAVVPLGAPVWLATTDPDGRPMQRLMVAQDVGSAIKGINRVDVFWGAGEAAFQQAGRMNRPGRTWVLVPKSLGPATS